MHRWDRQRNQFSPEEGNKPEMAAAVPISGSHRADMHRWDRQRNQFSPEEGNKPEISAAVPVSGSRDQPVSGSRRADMHRWDRQRNQFSPEEGNKPEISAAVSDRSAIAGNCRPGQCRCKKTVCDRASKQYRCIGARIRQTVIGAQFNAICTALVCRYSSRPSRPSSRPQPDCR